LELNSGQFIAMTDSFTSEKREKRFPSMSEDATKMEIFTLGGIQLEILIILKKRSILRQKNT